jgi:integrase
MPTLRLNKRNIENLGKPEAGQKLYYDDQLRGFGLRVGTRKRSFFAERQVHGRTIRTTIGDYEHLGPEQARCRALALLAAIGEGQNPNRRAQPTDAEKVTVKQAFDRFFAEKPQLSPKTTPNYRRTVDFYLADWRRIPLGQISRQMILARHRKIATEHGAVTANNAMRHFRSIYNYTAATVGDLPPNPVAILGQARMWSPERRRQNILPLHGLQRWHRTVIDEDQSARDFLLVALFTGMRRAEISGLEWKNIDLEASTLSVPQTKNGDALILPLSTYLHRLFEGRATEAGDSPWVFPGRGKTGHVVEVKSFVARVAKTSGIKFTLHDLRRTFATVAESQDIPAYALKRLLNHRSRSDVTEGYIVRDVERLRRPAEVIATYLEEKLTNGHSSLAARAA